jgi:hypothetical protein
VVSYTNDSGRRQILEDAAAAVGALSYGIAVLTEIYEQLDDPSADRLEALVFKPLQSGYGLLRRTLTEFATRYGMRSPAFPDPSQALPTDPRAALEHVADAAVQADEMLSELQDTLLPVEVGDAELRAGLSGTRTAIASVPGQCAELIRLFGR